eukprot:6165301-Pyramimonas_sp.AAC.1
MAPMVTSPNGQGRISIGLGTSAGRMAAPATSPDDQGRVSLGLGTSAGRSAPSFGVSAQSPSVPSRLPGSVATGVRTQRPGVSLRLPGNETPRGPVCPDAAQVPGEAMEE